MDGIIRDETSIGGISQKNKNISGRITHNWCGSANFGINSDLSEGSDKVKGVRARTIHGYLTIATHLGYLLTINIRPN